jgi:hypothetical protein
VPRLEDAGISTLFPRGQIVGHLGHQYVTTGDAIGDLATRSIRITPYLDFVNTDY